MGILRAARVLSGFAGGGITRDAGGLLLFRSLPLGGLQFRLFRNFSIRKHLSRGPAPRKPVDDGSDGRHANGRGHPPKRMDRARSHGASDGLCEPDVERTR